MSYSNSQHAHPRQPLEASISRARALSLTPAPAQQSWLLRGLLIALLAVLGTLSTALRADVITDWNNQLLDAIRAELTNPPQGSRYLALTNGAMFDAVNGVLGGYEPFHVTETRPDADPEAAAAAAAHRVLVNMYPSRTEIFDEALAASLSQVVDGPAKEAGIEWGEFCADQILALRAADNADLAVAYSPSGEPGFWEPTPEAYEPALQPNWPQVLPWSMARGSQFRSPPPPAMDSPEYTTAFNEVAAYGGVESDLRTAEQTEIAWFWADDPGTVGAPGRWVMIGVDIATREGLSLHQNARLFALQSMALADAAIVAWDNKYHYDHWRPHYGIHEADRDGNPDTVADTEWSALIPIPPFPAYTSGHSTFAGSGSMVMELVLGRDEIAFSSPPEGGVPASTRSFSSLSEAAEESGKSRIYGGSHWEYDNANGLHDGRSLARYVVFNHLREIGELSLELNQTHYDANGGSMELTATLDPAEPGERVDAYILLETPEGVLYYLQADGSLTTEAVPLVTNAETGPVQASLFTITLTGEEDIPVGTYAWMAELVRTGTNEPVTNMATAAFNVNPYSE